MSAPAHSIEPSIETPSPEERIRLRAYELYAERGYQSGSDVEDWLQAEAEIRQLDEDAKG